jgi:hypothetical protein
MIEPKVIFENEKKINKYTLDFKYIWIKNHKDILLTELKEYKSKLGWYAELYEDSNNYEKLYDIYNKLNNKIKKIDSYSLEKKLKYSTDYILKPDNNHFILEKDKYIYKGTKYFYTKEDEKEYHKTKDYAYYGDIYIAYKYMKRYNGGLQVYKVISDIKLFNITNDKNLEYIINKIKNKIKTEDIFFDNITYREFYKLLKIKYGIHINRYFQAYNIYKYSQYDTFWLYEPEYDYSEYKTNTDKTYTGWYFGAGRIDRYVASGIKKLIDNDFDGICGRSGFYSPYFINVASSEIIIWNRNKLKRKINNKYDSIQFIKKLDFNPLTIKFNIEYSILNKDFKYLYFYNNHKNLYNINNLPNGFSILSLNINNFKNINLNDTKEFIIEQLFKLIQIYNIDLCCLQSNKDIHIENNNFNIINKNNFSIISKYKISNCYNSKYGLYFTIDNIKFCNVKLDDNNFLYRKGSILSPKDLYNEINISYNKRIKILDDIMKENPEYIIGNFVFNTLDKEYEYFIKKYKLYSGITNIGTIPENKQVDFVFSKNKYEYISTLNFPYCATLPIHAIINL